MGKLSEVCVDRGAHGDLTPSVVWCARSQDLFLLL